MSRLPTSSQIEPTPFSLNFNNNLYKFGAKNSMKTKIVTTKTIGQEEQQDILENFKGM